MSNETLNPAPEPSAALELFEGRVAFQTGVRTQLAALAASGVQHLVMVDATFEDWPLAERAVAESLHAWAHSRRTCTLVARDWAPARLAHARFVDWRVRWSHIVQAWVCPSLTREEFPSFILAGDSLLQRHDAARSRGVVGQDASRADALQQVLTDLVSRSSRGFPAHILGL